jgi:phosphoglycerate dehydrogenase-like enzyme
MRALILAPFSAPFLDRLRSRLDVLYESWLDTNVLQDPAELGARLAAEDIAVLVIEADFVFEEVFEAAPGLRLVAVCRNALNQVDIESATAHGVAVTHAPGRNTNAVAEMTIAFMLALGRRIPSAHALVSGGGWRDPAIGYRRLRGREVAGSVVGVVGFGQIGREVARLSTALGARVLACDPIVSPGEMRGVGAEPVDLEEIIGSADFVTLHVPDTEVTYRMVDAKFLARMKGDAFLINTSGGAVVDAEALAEALAAGRIAGAALDVFEGHPLPQSSPLMQAPNLLMTPHIGGATAETVERHSRMISEEIERFIEGKPLRYAVNPDYAASRGR